MQYISELAYSSHIAQSSKAARDKRQKNKYQLSELIENDADIASQHTNYLKSTLWQGEDRRKGEDRREQDVNRGRYLEFRQTKDRREKIKIHVKI